LKIYNFYDTLGFGKIDLNYLKAADKVKMGMVEPWIEPELIKRSILTYTGAAVTPFRA